MLIDSTPQRESVLFSSFFLTEKASRTFATFYNRLIIDFISQRKMKKIVCWHYRVVYLFSSLHAFYLLCVCLKIHLNVHKIKLQQYTDIYVRKSRLDVQRAKSVCTNQYSTYHESTMKVLK